MFIKRGTPTPMTTLNAGLDLLDFFSAYFRFKFSDGRHIHHSRNYGETDTSDRLQDHLGIRMETEPMYEYISWQSG